MPSDMISQSIWWFAQSPFRIRWSRWRRVLGMGEAWVTSCDEALQFQLGMNPRSLVPSQARREAVEMAVALGRMASLELVAVELVAQVRTSLWWRHYGDTMETLQRLISIESRFSPDSFELMCFKTSAEWILSKLKTYIHICQTCCPWHSLTTSLQVEVGDVVAASVPATVVLVATGLGLAVASMMTRNGLTMEAGQLWSASACVCGMLRQECWCEEYSQNFRAPSPIRDKQKKRFCYPEPETKDFSHV